MPTKRSEASAHGVSREYVHETKQTKCRAVIDLGRGKAERNKDFQGVMNFLFSVDHLVNSLYCRLLLE